MQASLRGIVHRRCRRSCRRAVGTARCELASPFDQRSTGYLSYADLFDMILAVIWGVWRRGSRAGLDAQRAQVQYLAERAVQLEEAAERFKLAGNEKLAASFAQEAAELRHSGA
jgi:hypothetical protein